VIDFAHLRDRSDAATRAWFGAAEIAGPAGHPAFRPAPITDGDITLGAYLAAVRQLGSPALGAADILQLRERTRLHADAVLVGAEEIGPFGGIPAALAAGAGEAAPLTALSGATASTVPTGAVTCTRLVPGPAGGLAQTQVRPGQSLYVRPLSPGRVSVTVRRLAAGFPVAPLATVPAADGPWRLSFPVDRSALPWHVQLDATAGAALCLT
jgi:hypothetical protein